MKFSSEAVIAPAAMSGVAPGVAPAKAKPELAGHLNALDIALAALAYAGPLAGTAGYVSLLIGQGNGLGAPLAFFCVMVILLLFAVGYGALTRHVPHPGAFYAYITAGLGRVAGLGSAFLLIASYLTIGVGCYAFSGTAAAQFVEGFGGPTIPWWVYASGFWAGVAALGYFHVGVSAKILGVLLIAEVLVILVFDVLVFSNGGPEGISLAPFTWQSFTSGNLGVSLLFAIGLFSGFEATAIYREETRDPGKTIPRATLLVVLFIGLFYTVAAWALITALGVSHAVALAGTDPAGIFFTMARHFGGTGYYHVASALIITSIFAADLAIHNVTTRYIYSLSRDGILPRLFGVAHPRHQSPHRASLLNSGVYLTCSVALIAVGLTGDQIYAWFAGMAAFGLICAMTITSLATVVYFRRTGVKESLWAGSIAPALALAGLTAMVVVSYENFTALIGGSQSLANGMLLFFAIVFVIGLGMAWWLRRHRPETYRRIGRQD
jgi:amino acid transporter